MVCGICFFLKKQMIWCLDLYMVGVKCYMWRLAMELGLFSDLWFFRFGMCVTRRSLVKLLPNAFFFFCDRTICSSQVDWCLSVMYPPVYCKTFKERRPYVISMFYLVIPYRIFMQSCLVAHFLHGVDSHPVGQINSHCEPD